MEQSNDSEEFIKLSTKFLFNNFNDSTSDNNAEELNTLLNELNAICCKNQQIAEASCAVRLINSFSKIPSTEDTLIVKACCLIISLVKKQNIVIPQDVMNTSIEWLLKSLERSFHLVLCDVLRAMQVLLKGNINNLTVSLDSLVSPEGILIKLLKNPKYNNATKELYETNSTEEIQLVVIACIESLFIVPEGGNEPNIPDDYLKTIGNVVIQLIYSLKLENFSERNYCLLITAAINICKYIVTYEKMWAEEHVGELLGTARAFIMRGLPDVPFIQPEKIMMSQQTVLEPQHMLMHKGGKIAKARKPKAINRARKRDVSIKKDNVVEESFRQPYTGNNLPLEFETSGFITFKTSDSDFSESESNRAKDDRTKQTKLRLAAIHLIGTLPKVVEKRIMFGYWHCLFPADDNSSPSTITLLNCILRDPSPRCRSAALQSTALILFGSKPYLHQAENVDKVSASFTPFSVALGNMITRMYSLLTQALSSESHYPVVTQILKCFTVLIQATPFHRLKPGLVTELVKYVRKLVHHKDSTIKLASLMVMGFLLSATEITAEISECIGMPTPVSKKNCKEIHNTFVDEVIDSEYDEEEIIDSDEEVEDTVVKTDVSNGGIVDVDVDGNGKPIESKMSWLLQVVLETLGVVTSNLKTSAIHHVTTPVKLESHQILSAMSSHLILLKDHLQLVSQALQNSFKDSSPDVRLYAAKGIDFVGHAINQYLMGKGKSSEEMASYVDFWLALLPSITEHLQDTKQSAAMKTVCCDALSNIGGHVYERLPRGKQMLVISLLHGSSCDEDNYVRASAGRALAVFVLFPSLREDVCYVENTGEMIVKLVKDKNLMARVKATWALGNISDALIINGSDHQMDRISDDLLKKMFEVSIDGAIDHDKVRSNVMRTIGNLLRLIRKDHIQDQVWRTLCFTAIERLVKNATQHKGMKVKWNACYAMGNMMKNSVLFETNFNINWQALVFPALCDLVITNPNFKVRINAASALSVIINRQQYGYHFINIWRSLLAALEQAGHLVDFNEYKHRDNLLDQICITISHLIKTAQLDDFIYFKNELSPRLEITKQNWFRVANRVLPEQAAPLLEANYKLKELQSGKNMTADQRDAVSALLFCFRAPIEYND